jgi:hypothetical protein
MVGLKILAQITCQPFHLPFGGHTARRVDEVPNGFIKGVLYCRSRYLGSQTIGVLVGRKIQLGIQREDVIGISTTIALPPDRELPKQRLQATLTVAPTIGTLNRIHYHHEGVLRVSVDLYLFDNNVLFLLYQAVSLSTSNSHFRI